MARSKIIKRFGSMCFNGRPMSIGAEYHNEAFSFGDTVYGKEIRWVDTGDVLVADRCICPRISWTKLNDLGYIFGRAIRIDGKPYWCRSLEVGNTSKAESEWDKLMEKFGNDKSRWNWSNSFFWGQTIPAETAFPNTPPSRVIRGGRNARAWWYAEEDSASAGFRPVLEPLDTMPPFDTLIGKPILLYGPQKYPLEGVLVGVDEYDLVLDNAGPVRQGCSWAVEAKERQVFVRKDRVIWLEVA